MGEPHLQIDAQMEGLAATHLHAVLGLSFTPLASAMLLDEVEQVTLYSDDQRRAETFHRNFIKLFLKRKKGRKEPLVTIVPIPVLSESSKGDMLSMLKSLCELGKSLELKIAEQDVIFFSGTPAHIFTFIRLFGFNRVMTFEKGPNIELIDANETRLIRDFFDLNLDEVLKLHNLSEQICLGKESLNDKHQKLDARYVADISLEGATVVFEYVSDNYQKGGNRRRFCKYVRTIESHLGRYGVKHRVDNEMLSLWIRNTHRPPLIFDIGGEEE